LNDELKNGNSSAEAVRRFRSASAAELENLLFTSDEAQLAALLDNPALREPHLLVLLSRRDLPRKTINTIARNALWMRSYAMKAAVLKHPQTPRHLALPLLKHLYLFDLLGIARTPGLAADLKRMAEDAILAGIQAVAVGQKLTLARQGTARLAGGLLLDAEKRVIEAALENPAMTETLLAQALCSEKAQPCLIETVLEDSQWMMRRSVMLGLLRSRHLTLARFAALLPELTAVELTELRQDPRLPRNLRDYVHNYAASRAQSRVRSSGEND
jgi:hypothetical protein